MPNRFIVVSAINEYYLPLLADLLQSLLDCKTTFKFDIGVLDVGLSEQNRKQMGAYNVIVKTPGVDVDYPDRVKWEQTASYFRAMTSRPSIPKYFPGYDAYMWIDADAWVQTPEALETMLPAAAKDTNLYIAAEYDTAYTAARLGGHLWDTWDNAWQNCFPEELASKMRHYPMLNVGVFAMSARAPHWQRWHDILADALGRIEKMEQKHFIMEQLCMNLAVYRDGLGAQIMPAEYNWVTISGLPAFDEAEQLYVRPMPPCRPLSIVHLAAQIKNTSQLIQTTSGRTLERPLTYSRILADKQKRAS